MESRGFSIWRAKRNDVAPNFLQISSDIRNMRQFQAFTILVHNSYRVKVKCAEVFKLWGGEKLPTKAKACYLDELPLIGAVDALAPGTDCESCALPPDVHITAQYIYLVLQTTVLALSWPSSSRLISPRRDTISLYHLSS